MEKRDLYDDNRNRLNICISPSEEVPKGTYILIVIIFIQNKLGEFLIQKTSESKGSLFAATGGHPVSKESSLDGLKREVKEEIDIDLNEYDNLVLFKTLKSDKYFVDLYYLQVDNIDIDKLNIQNEEVEYLRWFTKEEIIDLIKKDKFRKSNVLMFKECLEYLDK